jgi:hypothetical protein
VTSARRRVARAEFGNDCCLQRCSERHVGHGERAELAPIESSGPGATRKKTREEKEEVVVDGT